MSLAPELLDLFSESVTLEPFVSQTPSGAVTYGAAALYPARIELQSEIMRTVNGRVVAGKGRKIYVAMTTIPSPLDRLTLPAAYGASLASRRPQILDISPEVDETGLVHHVALVVG